jgi:hypothetical protein
MGFPYARKSHPNPRDNAPPSFEGVRQFEDDQLLHTLENSGYLTLTEAQADRVIELVRELRNLKYRMRFVSYATLLDWQVDSEKFADYAKRENARSIGQFIFESDWMIHRIEQMPGDGRNKSMVTRALIITPDKK